MALTSARRWSRRGPAAETGLPDEIWEDIFLRFGAAADLVRVSATCSSFHRIVCERRFLRRFRSLHSPPVLGFLRYDAYRGFLPVGPPHSSAQEAYALVQAADFTFSFLPDPRTWRTRDTRDGRVLLSRRIYYETAFQYFLVCDPLHRRYVKIPCIPDDLLAASIPDYSMGRHSLPILAPAAENDGEESFRIICIVFFKDTVITFVFSSCNQTWRGINSTTETAYVPNIEYNEPYYAHGCVNCMGYSLMLDISEMKFSTVHHPPHNTDSMCAIVEAADGRLGFLTISDGTLDLYSKNRQNSGVGAQEWQHDKMVPLPKDSGINDYTSEIVGTAGRYVALLVRGNCYGYFVLDVKTLLLEKLCTTKSGTIYGFPYARFLPPLAVPSI